MRKKLVVANWKMHGNRAGVASLIESWLAHAHEFANADVATCAPFPYLAQVQSLLAGSRIAWGAQNVSHRRAGAFTGEVSGAMLRDFDCRYVIVGHSERRQLFDESDEVVADKLIAAQNVGLTPILCVGETLDERESGATQAVVGRQLEVAVERAGIGSFLDVVIAYEPVWAIGTGRTATPEQAQLVHHYIRQRLAERDPAIAQGVRILYGGSVKAANAAELCAMSDVDGGLVGGASLDADEFLAICRVASDQWVSADSSPRG